MPTESGLPSWFPEDFHVDPAMLAAHEEEHAQRVKGRKKPAAAQDDDNDES